MDIGESLSAPGCFGADGLSPFSSPARSLPLYIYHCTGYSTHGVHMSQRLVELKVTLSGKKLKILGPRTNGVYPPGPGWLYVLADGVPSKGQKVMIGKGTGESGRRRAAL